MDYTKTDGKLTVEISAKSDVKLPDTFFNRLANLVLTEVRCGMVESEGFIEYMTPSYHILAIWKVIKQQ